MAYLRKLEKWLYHARPMIEVKSLLKTSATFRRSSDDDVALARSVSARAGCHKLRSLSVIVEAIKTFVLEAFKGR